MAYTFDDFMGRATKAGMVGQFDADELELARAHPEYGLGALKLRQEMAGAKTPEQKLLAQETLNQIRGSYAPVTAPAGVRGSYTPAAPERPTAGSYAPTMDPVGTGFGWGGQDAYNAALNQVAGREDFQYDYANDPRFQAYKKEYLREGDRAQQNAIAQASVGTGGIPSSYAVTAAAQQGNLYGAKVADKVPELRDQAWREYLQKAQLDVGALQALGQERDFAFRQYLENYKRALSAWQMGQRSPELAAILGFTLDSGGSSSGGGYGGVSGGGGYGDSDVMNAYIQLKQAGASTRELDAMLKQEVQKGTISERDASEIRSSGYGGRGYLESKGFQVR